MIHSSCLLETLLHVFSSFPRPGIEPDTPNLEDSAGILTARREGTPQSRTVLVEVAAPLAPGTKRAITGT